jgi:hypothetical protein
MIVLFLRFLFVIIIKIFKIKRVTIYQSGSYSNNNRTIIIIIVIQFLNIFFLIVVFFLVFTTFLDILLHIFLNFIKHLSYASYMSGRHTISLLIVKRLIRLASKRLIRLISEWMSFNMLMTLGICINPLRKASDSRSIWSLIEQVIHVIENTKNSRRCN